MVKGRSRGRGVTMERVCGVQGGTESAGRHRVVRRKF